MVLRVVEKPAGLVTGELINAANLNNKLRNRMNDNLTSMTDINTLTPLVWDVQNPTNTQSLAGPTLSHTVTPGVINVDMSTFTTTDDVTLTLNGKGTYLIVGLNRDEAPDAEIFVNAPAGVNNTDSADLADPGVLRIHNTATFIAVDDFGRLLTKEAFYFNSMLETLENELTDLQALQGVPGQYVFYQTQLISQITSLIDSGRDTVHNIALNQMRTTRLNWHKFVLRNRHLSSGQGANNNGVDEIFNRATKIDVTDMTNSVVQMDLPCSHDMMKFIVVVPATAVVEKFEFNLVRDNATTEVNAVEALTASVRIVAQRQIPFDVSLDGFGQDNHKSSYGEEMTVHRQNGVAQVLTRKQ